MEGEDAGAELHGGGGGGGVIGGDLQVGAVVAVAADFELGKDEVELLLGLADFVTELADEAQAAGDGVEVADAGLEDDGLHGGELLGGVQVLENLENVADAEEAVSVLEEFGMIGWEVRSKRTLGGALPPLVLAGSASLACPTS